MVADDLWREYGIDRSTFKSLPDQQGMAIELHFIDHLNRRQVAEKLGVRPLTITRRINAGLKTLRGILSAPEL